MNISQEMIFLMLLLGLGILSKNQSIVISAAILLMIRLSGLGSKIFPYIDKNGVNLGVILITVAVLVPIATGEIKLVDLFLSIKSSYGILALVAGVFVSLLAAFGLQLLDQSPQMTISLVFGTILAVVFFKGIPVGPLIGAGIAMTLIKIYDWLFKVFS